MIRYIDYGDTALLIVRPAHDYGYGTFGSANPVDTIAHAWREVQRAGLTTLARREEGAVISEMDSTCEVQFPVHRDGATEEALRRYHRLDGIDYD